ncbi:chemotaxis protein CheW [Sporosarcina limicola]|uniref:Purine-binding chemotaxis protein CheW n=1 Tax=Sporosarcina limicola TaxID=34101 RepID=A0A927R3I9_9BACL|nr:chemotaxis protein CheW [Sporosarcina limicola]MBE1553818.1 purine-binding chemotaxis protein CheW [Sporosarcina limicola]
MSDLKAVIIQCGNEEYALPVETVVSIERLEQVNPIPHLPDYMLGLMRIRKELVPILDFEQILYGRSAKGHAEARVVLVKTKNLYIGLLVLDAKEILDIPEGSMSSTGLLAYSKTKYFITVANLENRIITVVDPEILSQTLAGMDEIDEYVKAQVVQSQ